MKKTLKIVTRKSPLAMWQANSIKNQLQKQYPNLNIEITGVLTSGDKEQTLPLTAIGGKTLFVKELQHTILEKQADIAVHCIKDMSVQPCPGLTLAVICERADPRDSFVANHVDSLKSLPLNSVIGTSSPRRQSLIKALRPDLVTKTLRGNVNTRLQKLDEGQYDAIILAAAGLSRLDQLNRIKHYFEPTEFIPAIGQGALGIECRQDDLQTQQCIHFLNHPKTAIRIRAERTVNLYLGGDCHTPLGVFASFLNDDLHVDGMVASLDGTQIIKSHVEGSAEDAETLGKHIADDLINKGAKTLLNPL